MSDARHVLGLRVDATSYSEAVDQVLAWASRRESRYVCFANVHMTMETVDHPTFREVVNGADLVAPDGGCPSARTSWRPCASKRRPRGFPLASTAAVQRSWTAWCESWKERYPALAVGFAESPPFRPLTGAEDAALVQRVRASGVPILLVGLGCPKQEMWMAARKGSIPAVMLGVGAAFDFLPGAKPQAPRWMGRAGLEWLFRLATEPRRLWLPLPQPVLCCRVRGAVPAGGPATADGPRRRADTAD